LHASRLGLRRGELTHPSVYACPARFLGGLFAILLRFFLGSVAFYASLPRLRRGELSDFPAQTDPAFVRGLFAIPLRFFLGNVTFGASGLRLRFRELHYFSANADPAFVATATVPLRFVL
jgi:hypothetical protein